MAISISLITVFPDLYKPFLMTSLIKRAQEDKKIAIQLVDFFSLVQPKERIDAPSVGHGAGMLIKPDVVQKAIEQQEAIFGSGLRIFFSPQGKKMDQRILEQISDRISQHNNHLILIAPRYEGVDERVEQAYADQVLSVGDFVLMDGDLPALMFLQGFLRLIPGVVGNADSVKQDSFSGPFVDYPEYTKPLVWQGKQVPEILCSGDHKKIAEWRMQQAAKKTVKSHFGWLRNEQLTDQEKNLAFQHIPPHYVVLMHTNVLIGNDRQVGTTSVTSLDLHDIARSAKTYGFQRFFVVTPLADQQKVVKKLLDFWQSQEGIEYNKNRHDAISNIRLFESLERVLEQIEKETNKKPLLVATSANKNEHEGAISFFDHEKVWSLDRPVLFVLGTGKGLSQDLIEKSDFVLEPLQGFSAFNHLSVRSAAAILFDRWIGLNPRNFSRKWVS